jgi:hypothetical protein
MRQSAGSNIHSTQSLFLGYRWIRVTISEYRQGNRNLGSGKGQIVIFPERHLAAALMHLYVGAFSLGEIAGLVSITKGELTFLRTQIDFMVLVDSFKASFARYFRQNLMVNEYSPVDYAAIAAEYAFFEELARNQIRIPLFRRMTQLAASIEEKERHQCPIDVDDLRSFKKLFSFFVFEKCFLPDLARPSSERLRTIAKETVWNRLGEDYDELNDLASSEIVRQGMADDLKTLLESLTC